MCSLTLIDPLGNKTPMRPKQPETDIIHRSRRLGKVVNSPSVPGLPVVC